MKVMIWLGAHGRSRRRPRSVAIPLCEAEKNPFSFFAVGSKENTLKDKISTLTKLGVEMRTINAIHLDKPSINGQKSL
jgi:hypothetical protein